jgi:UDP-N-acetylmuramoylalanine--D-glutamate ligase
MGEAAYTMDTLISSTKRKVVVGLGATGLSVARYLHRRGEAFCIVDTREDPPGLAALRAEMPDVPAWFGELPQDVLDTAGELIVSPGIAPTEPWLAQATAAGAALCGDIDLFVAEAQAPVIGITGSNAKSTVTALVGEMARRAGLRAGVGGNLGTPALDLLDAETQLYVLELSSFQLERAGKLGLAVATVLNLTADHLDRHGSMPRYHAAKHRIFNGCRRVVVNGDDPLTIPPLVDDRRVITWRMREPDLSGFGLREEDGVVMLAEGFDLLMPAADVALPGRHNLANALAALAIGRAAELPREAMLEALRTFRGLPHRCELVASADGVDWINDSKATNVGAALAAIEGLGSERRLVLIAGGRDKGADFMQLRPAVEKACDRVLLIGEAGGTMAQALEGACAIEVVGDLDAAVVRAAGLVTRGQAVLLSPACASFDQFEDFEHRGEVFRACVRALEER